MSFDGGIPGFVLEAAPFGPLGRPSSITRRSVQQAMRWLPLVANDRVWCMDELSEAIAKACRTLECRCLFVDGSDRSPAAPPSATLDLASCIRTLASGMAYLPAGGLARRSVDAQGNAGRLLDELQRAASDFDTIVVHAEATDIARLFKNRPGEPLLLTVDEPESLKQAYTSWKWLVLRCGWSQARLLVARASTERADRLARTLAACAEQYLNASLVGHAALDFSDSDPLKADAAIDELMSAHLGRDRGRHVARDAEQGLGRNRIHLDNLVEGPWLPAAAEGWTSQRPTPAAQDDAAFHRHGRG